MVTCRGSIVERGGRTMKTRIKWIEGVAFAGESGSGHAVVMDGAPESGGRNLGPRPMEMVLLGLGGCTAFDVVTILRKARQPVDDCVIEVEAQRAESVPKVFTAIHLRYVVTGRNLDEKQVSRAVNLSADKYCSVSRMLAATVQLSHDYVIQDSGE